MAHEVFDDADDAMERAEEILDGADSALVTLLPKDVTTSWQMQKTISNGSPTYGRKQDGVGVSVKKAKSGSWFYNVHGSAPQGRYGSAEEAMRPLMPSTGSDPPPEELYNGNAKLHRSTKSGYC